MATERKTVIEFDDDLPDLEDDFEIYDSQECPECGETIQFDIDECPWCGHDLTGLSILEDDI